VLVAIRLVDEDVLVVELVVDVVELDEDVLLVVEEEELDELDELLDDELLELEVLLVAAVYANVVVPNAVPPGPPHVALTVNVPVVHAAKPPGTDVKLKAPVVALTEGAPVSAKVPTEFNIVMTTAVPAPGAGDTTPVMWMGVAPVYVGWSVWTVTV